MTYFGIMRGRTSWGKVGREMVCALVERGVDVNIFERKGFLFDPEMSLPETVTRQTSQSFRNDVVFTFEHPGVYKYLEGTLKIGMLCYESTIAPPHWVEHVNRHLDLLLVPTTFCYQVFQNAGVPAERIRIIPYGYDSRIYTPQGAVRAVPDAAKAGFRFLTVACPHKRKGLGIVLEAYRRAFSRQDDVSLTVKLNYLPKGKAKPFEHRDVERELERFRVDVALPRLAVMSEYIVETELAALYRGASCLVSATRGEGFGMVYLEALACGLPVIVTGWGGHMDFINEANARVVKYTLRPAREIQYDCDSPESLIAEPDVDDLAAQMRAAYDSGQRRPLDTVKALERFTWPRLAAQFLEVIEPLSGNVSTIPKGPQ